MPAHEQAKTSEGGEKDGSRGAGQPAGGDAAGMATTAAAHAGDPVKRRPGRPKSTEAGTPQQRYREREQRKRAADEAFDKSQKEKNRQHQAKHREKLKAAGKKLSETAMLTRAQTIRKLAVRETRYIQFDDKTGEPIWPTKVPRQGDWCWQLDDIRSDIDCFMASLEEDRRTQPAYMRTNDEAFVHGRPFYDGKVPYRPSTTFQHGQRSAAHVYEYSLRSLERALHLGSGKTDPAWVIVGKLLRRYFFEADADKEAVWEEICMHKTSARSSGSRGGGKAGEGAGAGPGPSTTASRVKGHATDEKGESGNEEACARVGWTKWFSKWWLRAA